MIIEVKMCQGISQIIRRIELIYIFTRFLIRSRANPGAPSTVKLSEDKKTSFRICLVDPHEEGEVMVSSDNVSIAVYDPENIYQGYVNVAIDDESA